jgi:hypothetical protein
MSLASQMPQHLERAWHLEVLCLGEMPLYVTNGLLASWYSSESDGVAALP